MDNPEKLATQGTHDEEKQNKTQHNTICVSYVKDGINSYFYSSLIDVVRQLIRKCQLRSIDFHSLQLICICYLYIYCIQVCNC